MKNKHLFWGLLFITFGVLFLFNNFIKFNYDWESIWKFWPLVVVLLGLSFLIKSNILKGFLISLSAILLGLALFSVLKAGWLFFDDHFPFDSHDQFEKWEISDEDTPDDSPSVKSAFSEKYSDSLRKALLTVEAGAGTFLIKDTTADLIKIKTEGRKDYYSLDRADQGEKTTLNFRTRRTRFSFNRGRFKSKVQFNLNSKPAWDFNFEFGAASIDFDLSKIRAEQIQMAMGAASLKLKLGDLSGNTKLNLEAGASSIEIWVPRGSGCEIKSDFALASKDFEGFNKISSGLYRTENFNSAGKKIYMNIDAGISSIEVKRY